MFFEFFLIFLANSFSSKPAVIKIEKFRTGNHIQLIERKLKFGQRDNSKKNAKNSSLEENLFPKHPPLRSPAQTLILYSKTPSKPPKILKIEISKISKKSLQIIQTHYKPLQIQHKRLESHSSTPPPPKPTNPQIIDSRDIFHFGQDFMLANHTNRPNVYKIYHRESLSTSNLPSNLSLPIAPKVKIIDTPKTKQCIYFPKKDIIVFYYKKNISLVHKNEILNYWAECHRYDKYKVLRKDEYCNLFYLSAGNAITIIKDLKFERFSSQKVHTVEIDLGEVIVDYKPLHYYSVVAFITTNGYLSIYNWQSKLMGFVKLKLKKGEQITCLNVCIKNKYFLVATCNAEHHSPKLYLYEFVEMENFKFLHCLDFDDLEVAELAKKKSSYIYDVNMDFYYFELPVIVAVQCHYDRKIFVFSVLERKLSLICEKDGQYSNVRVVMGNGKDSVAVIGSNQVVSVVRFKLLSSED